MNLFCCTELTDQILAPGFHQGMFQGPDQDVPPERCTKIRYVPPMVLAASLALPRKGRTWSPAAARTVPAA